MTAADQPTTEPSRDDPIPRYAQLDVWMALYGSHRSEEYEPYREQHGFALTWANLCWEVSQRAPQPAADTETLAKQVLLDAADHAEEIITNGDVAEIAAAPPGAVGRQAAVDARDSLYNDPVEWLRSYAEALREEA